MSKKFTKSHEWALLQGDMLVVGITNYAQSQLGDVVFVEVPSTGQKLNGGAEAGVVESVKAASDIYMPVSGEIVQANDALAENPALVNEAPEGAGWFFKMKPDNPADLNALMDEAAYAAYIEGLS